MLRKLPFGITEAVRQWYIVLESWLVSLANFSRVTEVSQFFIRHDETNHFAPIIEKVTDDILMAGSVEDIKYCTTELDNRFLISKSIIHDEILFNSGNFFQDADENVSISMKSYMEKIDFIPLENSGKNTETSP